MYKSIHMQSLNRIQYSILSNLKIKATVLIGFNLFDYVIHV